MELFEDMKLKKGLNKSLKMQLTQEYRLSILCWSLCIHVVREVEMKVQLNTHKQLGLFKANSSHMVDTVECD